VSTDGTGAGDPSPQANEEAAWREIVDHYGERARLSSEDLSFSDDVDQEFEPDAQTYHPAYNPLAPSWDPLAEERFVPPEPPPLPRVSPERLLAWLGVLGVPLVVIALMVVSAVTSWSTPTWLDAFLVIGFLGGFGYLVATMSKEPHDPDDDGAQV
jgi:hypothetical protein